MISKDSQTAHNLLAAFAGESQARNRYTFYAGKARDEGLIQLEAVFLETAEQERVHAKKYFSLLPGETLEITASYPTAIGDTLTNLRHAAEGELEEHSKIYPEMAKVAEAEGYPEAARCFRQIAEAEKYHEGRYRKLLKRVEEGTLFKRDGKIFWKCRKCGRVVEAAQAPLRCPTCDHPQGWFEPLTEPY